MEQGLILGPELGYVDIFLYELEESIKAAHSANKTFQRTPIRPSSAGKCARELYFEFMQYSGRATYQTKPMTGETDLLLNLGHAIEAHLIAKLKTHLSVAEVKYMQQVLDFGILTANIDERLTQHLEGSIDLCLWSDKWKCVIDVKSKGDNYNFKTRKMKWDDDNEKLDSLPSVKHLSERTFWVESLEDFLAELGDPFFEANFKQLNMYLNSDFIMARGIDHGAIIQYHKNKSKLREIRFKPSQAVYQNTISKFQNVIRAVDEDKPELAPQEYEDGSYKCRYCNFVKECWSKKGRGGKTK